MYILLSILLAYLLGSISTSTLITRWRAKIDIRDVGSGNAGATNTLRVLGVRWGLVVLALDACKGVLATLLAMAMVHHQPLVWFVAGLAVVVGHNWPVFFGFRGGKGIATTIGVYLVLLPIPALVAGVIAILLIAVTRYVSLGALSFVILTPVFCIAFGRPVTLILFAVLIAALSVYRHRQNIVRLVRGQEHRVFSRHHEL
ncbi:glycerol-3-phosphate 1-O-acyltransferase PlsY [Alicyclobacillus sp. ALC3]|uniref:glycerol-3-phosphate 1-O-acyltransferase PlsY n=1 Tax=Alicyclobacillus sp. ALC3 TaxID=2796143 RepID=UPI0023798F48|nr:glycerol-3-phosphate 1-O-acyltransferase PlsY [Alicyclobacillus sp. ALC3]WDL97131.1 glycerol-3-phosphate 1-O-acyltransferase PlsY [Alicyclobacillus sp. ALC3]